MVVYMVVYAQNYVCVNWVGLNLDQHGREPTSLQLCRSAISQDFQPTKTDAGQLVRNLIIPECNTAVLRRSDVAGTSSHLDSGRRYDTEIADLLTVNVLEYSWVTQHHSASSFPDCWSQPMKLLSEFCQTEDYKSCLASSVASSEDVPSCFHGSSISRVRSELPASMELKCSAPHLHRWNPSASADFTDYFHDRIKVLLTGGTLYRC